MARVVGILNLQQTITGPGQTASFGVDGLVAVQSSPLSINVNLGWKLTNPVGTGTLVLVPQTLLLDGVTWVDDSPGITLDPASTVSTGGVGILLGSTARLRFVLTGSLTSVTLNLSAWVQESNP